MRFWKRWMSFNQWCVRARDDEFGFGFDERVRLGFARRAFRSPRSLRDRLTGEPERRFQTS